MSRKKKDEDVNIEVRPLNRNRRRPAAEKFTGNQDWSADEQKEQARIREQFPQAVAALSELGVNTQTEYLMELQGIRPVQGRVYQPKLLLDSDLSKGLPGVFEESNGDGKKRHFVRFQAIGFDCDVLKGNVTLYTVVPATFRLKFIEGREYHLVGVRREKHRGNQSDVRVHVVPAQPQKASAEEWTPLPDMLVTNVAFYPYLNQQYDRRARKVVKTTVQARAIFPENGKVITAPDSYLIREPGKKPCLSIGEWGKPICVSLHEGLTTFTARKYVDPEQE